MLVLPLVENSFSSVLEEWKIYSLSQYYKCDVEGRKEIRKGEGCHTDGRATGGCGGAERPKEEAGENAGVSGTGD